MAIFGAVEGDGSCLFNHSPIKGIGDTRTGPRTAESHTAVSLKAEILMIPGDFVTREFTRICRGFSLVDRADQTEEIPCLTAVTKKIPVPHFCPDQRLARIDNNDSRPFSS